MRIIVVDDHEVVRHGLAAALATEDVELVGTAGTAAQALDLARSTRPDLAVVDLRLPDLSGVELVRRLVAARPGIAVVVLSTYLDEVTVRACLDAGARAYVTKSAGVAELRTALRRVRDDRSARPERAEDVVARMRDLVGARAAARLTPQQERVLVLVASGLTNQQVADRLYLSESTVRFHLQRLRETVGARTRSELVAKATRLRLVEPWGDEPGVPE